MTMKGRTRRPREPRETRGKINEYVQREKRKNSGAAQNRANSPQKKAEAKGTGDTRGSVFTVAMDSSMSQVGSNINITLVGKLVAEVDEDLTRFTLFAVYKLFLKARISRKTSFHEL